MSETQTIDEEISEHILKPGEKLPPAITVEPGRLFDGDCVFRYTTGPGGKRPTVNEIGALVTLIGRVDKMNPRYRYGNGYLWKFLEIQLNDDRIYPWQSVNERIHNILRSENGF